MKRADRAIMTSGVIVAASTAGLAAVRGFGTVMFQFVVLGAWSIVARLSSGMFADRLDCGARSLPFAFSNSTSPESVFHPAWFTSECDLEPSSTNVNRMCVVCRRGQKEIRIERMKRWS